MRAAVAATVQLHGAERQIWSSEEYWAEAIR